MGADAGLRLAYRRHKLADGALAVLEQLQDAEAGGVSQHSEEAGGSLRIDSTGDFRYHIR